MEKEDTMSRNGSGTYSLPAGNPVTTGTTISSTWANSTLSDMATALTQSIAYDGQTTPVANLPMGGFNHTNVANAAARNQYASAGQVEDGTLNYLTSVAGTNAITATAPVSMSAYVAGQTFRFIAAGANTGACTLNLNSIGAKSLVKTDGSALVSGDIASGAAVQVMYDGTNFQLLSDANGATETVTTLTATTKVVTPQIGSSSGSFTIQSANTTAVTVDSSQNVGIGTTDCQKRLTVNDSSSSSTTVGTNPVVWIGGGASTVNTLSEIGFTYGGTSWAETYTPATIGYQLKSGSGFTYGDLTFCTRSVTTDTAPSERMRIDSSGNVLVGTTSSFGNGRLQVAGASAENVSIKPGGNNYYMGFYNSAGSSVLGSISTNGSTTSFNTSSDYRLKENVAPMTGALNVIAQLKPVTYKWIADGSDGQGFIAHELAEVVPDCVTGEKDAVEIQKYEISPAIPATYDDEGNELTPAVEAVMGEREAPVYQGIDTSFLVATLTAAIQEQQAIITDLKSRIEALEAK